MLFSRRTRNYPHPNATWYCYFYYYLYYYCQDYYYYYYYCEYCYCSYAYNYYFYKCANTTTATTTLNTSTNTSINIPCLVKAVSVLTDNYGASNTSAATVPVDCAGGSVDQSTAWVDQVMLTFKCSTDACGHVGVGGSYSVSCRNGYEANCVGKVGKLVDYADLPNLLNLPTLFKSWVGQQQWAPIA